MNDIHVVAAVIYSADKKQILVAKRPDHLHQGGLWEFPGGKVQPGEQPLDALARELFEELAITLTSAAPFMQVRHRYPDKAVLLDVWQVWQFTGVPHGNEGQQITWMPLATLGQLQFPAANLPILEALISKSQSLPAP